MNNNKFQHRNLPMLLLRARESVMRYFRKDLKKHGLTEQQWRVIRVLNEFGEMETGRVAEESCILAPSLSGILDRMEQNGLIVRHRLSSDQRKVYVDLTTHSKNLVGAISRSIETQYSTLKELLGQESLLSVYALLDTLIALPDPAQAAAKVVRTPLNARAKAPAGAQKAKAKPASASKGR